MSGKITILNLWWNIFSQIFFHYLCLKKFRNAVAKDIILRFSGSDGWELSEGPSPTTFVTQSLSVPPQWVDEATAYRLGYLSISSNVWGKVVYYLARAGKTKQAKAVMCERIAPGAVLRSAMAADKLLSLLEGIGRCISITVYIAIILLKENFFHV